MMTNRLLRRPLTCFALLLLAVIAQTQAKNIFVAQASRGNNTGADAANAHPATWFNTGGNWGTGVARISAGDTVHLSGTISTGLTVNGSGTTSMPINILFDQDAKLSAPVWSPNAITVNEDWIIIDGGTNGLIECTDNGTTLGHRQENVYGIFGSGTGITVRNLTIYKIYVRTPFSTSDALRAGEGIELSGSNITVTGCTLREGDTMISLTWTAGRHKNYTITGNTIGRCNHGITVGTADASAFLDSVIIADNIINDLDVWGPISGNHLDGMIIFNESPNYSGRTNVLRIYGNRIGPNIGTINTAGVFVICYIDTQFQNLLIYNNIFTSRSGYAWSNGFIAAAGKDCIIANNTFIGSCTAITTQHHASCYNNLAYGIDGGLVCTPSASPLPPSNTIANWDYNVLYFGKNSFLMVYNTYGDRYDTKSSWQSATGFDTHSSTSKPALDTVTGMLKPGDTVATGKGKNLSEYFSTDFFGGTRPRAGEGSWDIGAHQSLSNQKAAPRPATRSRPNPAARWDRAGNLVVWAETNGPGSDLKARILDIAGRVIAVKNLSANEQWVTSLSAAQGAYLLEVSSEGTPVLREKLLLNR